MTKQRASTRVVLALLSLVMAVPAFAAGPVPPPSIPQKAGNISALLPTANIVRGSGKAAISTAAKKGDELLWQDLVRTEKGGRARITLADQSILSLGSQAELRILKHDARSQQTALALTYGRVRAEVASVTRDGGRFELRTPTAVAGVIGTDFGTTSSIGDTTFLCISGLVQVANADPAVPGTVPCAPGMTTSVQTGKAPTAPKPATQQQIQQLIQDTEPAVINAFSPGSTLPGTTVDATATGSKMAGISKVSISGAGVTASLNSGNTESSAVVHLVIDANAAPGPRTITFTKGNGQASAAVFTVLAPPSASQGTDLAGFKKSYLDVFEQERQTAIAGLNGMGVGLQQSIEQAAEQIQKQDDLLPQKLSLNDFNSSMKGQVDGLLSSMTAGGTKMNTAAADASKSFSDAFDAAQKALLARNPGGVVDDAFRASLTEAFNTINKQLLASFDGIHTQLGAEVLTRNASVSSATDAFLEKIKLASLEQQAPPTPRVDAEDRSGQIGDTVSFDAGRSQAIGGASIASYNWTLCDASYKPTQLGVILPVGAPSCNAISGYAGSGAEFKINTCGLAPQEYIARLKVIDTNNKMSQTDVKVRVLPPTYDDPKTRLQALAGAYSGLQSAQFLAYFDENYSGYTSLQENVRNTFNALSSMSINLLISQAEISCNEGAGVARVRADWDQNYTFKDDKSCETSPGVVSANCQRVVFHQKEQLTVKMNRVPGKGWFISEFQGDNGSVQGSPPGPRITDTALPDLQVGALNAIAGAARTGLKISAAQGIAPGNNVIQATVVNVGDADLNQTAKLRFSVRDSNNNEIAFNEQDVPTPLKIGASLNISGTVSLPTDLAPGTAAKITATVNPGCVVPERNCDGANISTLDVVIGVIDLEVSNLQFSGSLIGTVPSNATVTVKNLGSRASFAGTLAITSPDLTGILGSVAVPSLAPGASQTFTLSVSIPNTPGAHSFVATANTQGDTNTANNTASLTATITAPSVDLQALTFAFSGGNPPFSSGQTHAVTFTVKNAGNAASSANDTYACRLVNGTASANLSSPASLGSLAPGATSALITVTFVVPASTPTANFIGANSFVECRVSQDPFEAATNTADNVAGQTAAINPNIDLQVASLPAIPFVQMGASGSIPVTISNAGLDTAGAGWDVVIKINGTAFASGLGSALAGGSSTAVTVTGTAPQLQAAPADASFPGTVQVNANAAIAETNTANNTLNTSLRMVDFTLTSVASGTGVAGRPFNFTAVTVNPGTYPAPPTSDLTINYSALPAGTSKGGTFGGSIVGTPTAAGSGTASVSATSSGVTHSGSNVAFNILNEISVAPAGAVTLTAGGSPSPMTVNVTGGVYPVSVTVSLPSGVSTTNPLTQNLTGPGSVTWNLTATFAAATGSGSILVTGTDGGIPATATPAGNKTFLIPYNNNAQANYVISSITFPGVNPPTGLNALQDGTQGVFLVTITDTGNDPLQQVSPGTLSISLNCQPSNPNVTACQGGNPPVVVSAPRGAGDTVQAQFNFGTLTLPAGGYTGIASFTTTLPQSSTSDDTFSSPFDVFDFNLTTPAQLNPQNIKAGGSGTFTVVMDQTGRVQPISIPMTLDPGAVATVTGLPANMTDGNSAALTIAAPGTASGDSVITVHGTRAGVDRLLARAVRFYTASLDNITSGQPGSTANNPILLPNTSTAATVTFQVSGNFVGTPTINVTPSPGITTNNSTFRTGNQFDVTLSASAFSGTVQIVTINAIIPSTSPGDTVQYQLFVLAKGTPDLQITNVVPSNGRNFSSNAWLYGEPVNFDVTVANTGAISSSGGETVRLYSGSTFLGSVVLASGLPSGGQTVATIHAVCPDPFPGPVSVRADVSVSAAGDLNTGNNTFFSPLSIPTADWSLTPGNNNTAPVVLVSNLIPAIIPINGPWQGTSSVSFSSQATPLVSIDLVNGIVSTRTSMTIGPPTSLSSPNALGTSVAFSIPFGSAAGPYMGQVIGQMKDGNSVTAQRQATIPLVISGTASTVTVTSSPDTTSTPLQINGVLTSSLNLTANNPSASAGATVDLHFTDSTPIISMPGSSQQHIVTQYGVSNAISFAAAEAADGTITAGNTTVTVSATSAQVGAVRGVPITPTVGNQLTTLNFRIGDIFVTAPGCTALAPTVNATPGTATVLVNWAPTSGFNAQTVTWQWLSVPGGVSLNSTSPSTLNFDGSGYGTGVSTTFTNNNTTDLGQQSFIFQVTISNGQSSASKFFPISFALSSLGCNFSADGGGLSTGSTMIRGSWRDSSGGGVALMSKRTTKLAEGGAPDLQLDASQVSFSPSIPKAGDTLHVRFKVSNAGNAGASRVPIALQVNGRTVASDTVDLAAGRSTLGSLDWVITAGADPAPATRFRRISSRQGVDVGRRGEGEGYVDRAVPMSLAVVVDPDHTVTQKSATLKSAALAHFSLRRTDDGDTGTDSVLTQTGVNSGMDKLYLEVSDEGCVGFRFGSGSNAPCETADLEVMVEDMANGRYSLQAEKGIVDLGAMSGDSIPEGLSFSNRAAVQAGHSYAVQLGGGKVGILRVDSVLSPRQLYLKTGKVFGRKGRSVARRLGGDSGPTETGDVSGIDGANRVYFELQFRSR